MGSCDPTPASTHGAVGMRLINPRWITVEVPDPDHQVPNNVWGDNGGLAGTKQYSVPAQVENSPTRETNANNQVVAHYDGRIIVRARGIKWEPAIGDHVVQYSQKSVNWWVSKVERNDEGGYVVAYYEDRVLRDGSGEATNA